MQKLTLNELLEIQARATRRCSVSLMPPVRNPSQSHVCFPLGALPGPAELPYPPSPPRLPGIYFPVPGVSHSIGSATFKTCWDSAWREENAGWTTALPLPKLSTRTPASVSVTVETIFGGLGLRKRGRELTGRPAEPEYRARAGQESTY